MPYLFVFLKGLLWFVALVFFLSGLDDCFIDLYYAVRSVHRRLFVLPKYRPLTETQLLALAEQPVAVMIPAWQEAPVIRQMLENTIRTLNYANYHIFVGTYPNDPETRREVEAVREHFDNVHRIVCPKDGPTNKADCLNWIYQGIKLFEKEHRLQFAVFVMDDSEDLVHPLSLKNYLIPRKDMIQLVVLPLEPKWSKFTEGHYCDEFAEMHYKNLVVREFLSHSMPSAGVGCAFSRRAVEAMTSLAQNQLFNINSLTEDYDIGLRLDSLGLKTIFVKQAIDRYVSRRNFFTGKWRQVKVQEFISTRGPFPKTFRTAVRQKSRWIVGICLQGWANPGWPGDLSGKYMLFRDRKSLLTSYVNMLGYVVVTGILLYWLWIYLSPEAYRYPPLVERGTWLWYLILADTFFMVLRIYYRALCTFHFYGLGQALFSRLAVSGFANARTDPQTLGKIWKALLSEAPIDEVLFQDGVGAQKLSLADLSIYLPVLQQAVASQGREFRVVVELFRQVSAGPFKAQPAPWTEPERQLSVAAPYSTSGLMAFSIPKYLTPLGGPEAARLYKTYLDWLRSSSAVPGKQSSY
ncbi:MAG: DUF4434 domain-containing protein [Thermodesulfobacteriota bacterium]